MNYYYDFEFIEDGKTIDPISVGVVADDDREYYAINKQCDFSAASSWVWENVLAPMGITQSTTTEEICALEGAKTRKEIAHDLRFFFAGKHGPKFQEDTSFDYPKIQKLKLWAYYADYDHVALCQLYGKMIDLPKGLPMYTHDLKQLCVQLGDPHLAKQKEGIHNALSDARWVRETYNRLITSV